MKNISFQQIKNYSVKDNFTVVESLKDKFYLDNNIDLVSDSLSKFIHSISINNEDYNLNIEKTNNLNIENGFLISNDDTRILLPFSYLRKLIFLIIKKDLNKIPHSSYIELFNSLDDYFLIEQNNFPYPLIDFLYTLNKVEIQKIFNDLISKRLVDEKMLLTLLKKDRDNLLTKNLPGTVIEKINNLKENNEFDERWHILSYYQLKYNFSYISDSINHKGIKLFNFINNSIKNLQVKNYIDSYSLENLFSEWKKENILYKIFSVIDNDKLAILIRSQYANYFLDNCSKRRIELIKEEKNYKAEITDIIIINALAEFIISGINIEYESKIKDYNKAFINFVRGIKGEKDFSLILSRMSPLEFGMCFKNSNSKVQSYIIKNMPSPVNHFLLDLFKNKIKPVTFINKGMIGKSREKFTKIAFLLNRINKINYIEPQD